MARIRTIKPTIWTDDAFIELSRDARLLVFGMVSFADDDGRLAASPVSLLGSIYPYDDDVTIAMVEQWRDEAVRTGLIYVYQAGRGTFAAFPKWHRHQVINRYTASRLPAPQGIECDVHKDSVLKSKPASRSKSRRTQ